MNPATAYWDRGPASVPQMTGAADLMDGGDLMEIAAGVGLPLPLPYTLDVGCGTGRIARHCASYHGVDISRDAVRYCTSRGVYADAIDGPEDLRGYAQVGFNLVTCMSVFTHIDEFERVAYLGQFARIAPELLVDIVPGTGDGDVRLWTMDPARFASLLRLSGYAIVAEYERPAKEGYSHRYYYARVTG